LAATQVDIHQRIIVIDVSELRQQLYVFINPKITQRDGSCESDEGCLSVPGISATVERAQKITVEALDYQGKPFQLEAEGLLAICIQHEIDHLNGKVFVEKLSQLKQNRILAKLKKSAKLKRYESIPLELNGRPSY
jgi:peptide deformylase